MEQEGKVGDDALGSDDHEERIEEPVKSPESESSLNIAEVVTADKFGENSPDFAEVDKDVTEENMEVEVSNQELPLLTTNHDSLVDSMIPRQDQASAEEVKGEAAQNGKLDEEELPSTELGSFYNSLPPDSFTLRFLPDMEVSVLPTFSQNCKKFEK